MEHFWFAFGSGSDVWPSPMPCHTYHGTAKREIFFWRGRKIWPKNGSPCKNEKAWHGSNRGKTRKRLRKKKWLSWGYLQFQFLGESFDLISAFGAGLEKCCWPDPGVPNPRNSSTSTLQLKESNTHPSSADVALSCLWCSASCLWALQSCSWHRQASLHSWWALPRVWQYQKLSRFVVGNQIFSEFARQWWNEDLPSFETPQF